MTARARIGASTKLAVGTKRTDIYFRFTTDANGDPTVVDGEYSEGVDSVTKTAEGVYQVTLGRQYNKVLFADCKKLGAHNDTLKINPTAVANASGKTSVSFTHYSGGAAADVDSSTLFGIITVKGR
jgi:hypothetical protein